MALEPELSVVIPAYAAAATIGATIDGLAAQQAAPRFEVILVDSSPDASTADAARAALERHATGAVVDCRIERLGGRAFPGTARNRGAALARAPLLVFLDADAAPAPDLLATTLRTLAADADVAGGSIALPEPAAVSARLRHLLQFKESLPGLPRRRTWMLPSACVAYRRAVFERYGGFPDTRASEDWVLHWRMWQAGERMLFEPDMRVVHATPAGWLALARYSRLLGYHSGVARRVAGLPGQAVVRWPILSAGLPLARTGRALVWCARHAPREFAFLAVTWPAYLAITAVWALGFAEGVSGRSRSKKRLAPARPL